MKLKGTVVVAALVAAIGAAGCSDDDGPIGPEIGDLAGTWSATTLTFSPASSSSGSSPIPFIGLGGALEVTIDADGDFTGILTVPGAVTGGAAVDLPVSGNMSLDTDADPDLIVVDFSANTEAVFAGAGLPFEDFDGPFQLSGSQLTITNDTDFDFDLGGPGAAEAATMTMVLVRS